MKLLKILLIIVLLIVPLYSYGTGHIQSGDKTYMFEPAEPTTLNEWFYNLKLSEKIKVYNDWEQKDEKDSILEFLESIGYNYYEEVE